MIERVLIGSGCALFLLAGATRVAGEESAVLEAIIARQEGIQNIEVSYQRDETFSPPDVLKAKTARLTSRRPRRRAESGAQPEGSILVTGSRSWECLFRHLDGKAYFEQRRADAVPPSQPAVRYSIQSYLGDRSESASRQTNQAFDSGAISNERPLPDDAIVDVALGLRSHTENKWLPPDAWRTFEVERGQDGAIRLKRPGSTAGFTDYRTDVWTFDSNLGYALVRYEVLFGGKPGVEVQNSDFRRVGSVLLPHRIEWRMLFTDGAEVTETATKTVEVSEYRLDRLKDDSYTFLITWPDGTLVYDMRTNRQITVRDGPRKLYDQELQTYMQTGQLPPPGRSLNVRLWIVVGSVAVLVVFTAVMLVRRRVARS